MKNPLRFFQEVKQEAFKVTWPTKKDVVTGALMDQSKGFGVNAVYRYPKLNGFGNIGKCLADKCKDRIITGMEATQIDVQNREIQFNNEKIISS